MDDLNVLCVGSVVVEASTAWAESFSAFISAELGGRGVHVWTAACVSDAEEHLFGSKISLLIADASIDGVADFVRLLKKDEMFRFLPVLVVHDGSAHQDWNLSDRIVKRTFDASAIGRAAVPLLRTKIQMEELIVKIAGLQEDSLTNFILLDLVKRYVPLTVWKMVQRFAREQRITVPETEEEVTIVYGDLVGFTAFSQHLSPKEIIDMLNEVFAVVNSITYRYGGDIDKFIGDAFFAVFTSSLPAISAALAIQQAMGELRARHESLGKAFVSFRIGMHTGRVIRGNVGTELRSDNTLIGDTVNTAARIEQICAPGEVYASVETCRQADLSLPDAFLMYESVKGKDDPVALYNLSGYLRENPQVLRAIMDAGDALQDE